MSSQDRATRRFGNGITTRPRPIACPGTGRHYGDCSALDGGPYNPSQTTRSAKEAAMDQMTRPLLVGAQASEPNGVLIWRTIRQYFIASGVPMDYALFSTYDA